MFALRRTCCLALVGLLAGAAWAQEDPGQTGSYGPAQTIADELKGFTGAEGAFFAAGLLRGGQAKGTLSAMVQFPSDSIVVLNLRGSVIRQAFEQTLSLYPHANSGFLQISGFEVTFNPALAPEKRVLTILAGGARLEENRVYTVAMPSSLARGGYGYFKLWDKSNVVKTFEGATLESVLRGKRASDSSPRWSVAS